jgi:salicylate hydroxylase
MDPSSDDRDWSFRAIHSFNIVIVGAGIAALTSAIGLKKAGHDVIILEQAREITDVGAGIQMAPNATRIMRRFGLLDQIMAKSNELQATSLRRWQDDRELGSVPMMPSVSSSRASCQWALVGYLLITDG